jgi:nicotinate phosphoribosyltransferase
MSLLAHIYRPSLALLTDLYQLTMAYGYWKAGLDRREAAFHLVFREHPFGGGFTLACGLAQVAEFLERFSFSAEDLGYLGSLPGADGRPLFAPAFLDFLARLRLESDVDAVPEGTVVFPHEPLVRVTGPLLHGQLLETPLLNLINFQTLIATKAARVVLAAEGAPVYEFGLRRAQGIDGALSAARAAYVGGCAGTSNLLAGQALGIPVKGTHAHSWVMCFDDELAAFDSYAAAMPNNCLFLVDTYHTLSGVRHAAEVGHRLRAQGQPLLGVRLDSGDLAGLSREARKILDAEGFPQAAILASNDLDEHRIAELKQQGAAVTAWGVGTRLVTGQDDPALGGVYKLTAVRDRGQPWQGRVKVSEQPGKTSTPGVLQVRRYLERARAVGDAIYDVDHPLPDGCLIVDREDPARGHRIAPGTPGEDLLVPVLRGGRRVGEVPSLDQARHRAQAQLALFDPAVKRFVHPDRYPAGLEAGLHRRKLELIRRARGERT